MFGHFSMTINKKAFATRSRTAALAIKLIVGTFHKFFREFFKYGLKFLCNGSFNFWYHLKI